MFHYIAIHQIFVRQSPLMGQLRLRRLSANQKVSSSIWIPQLRTEPSPEQDTQPQIAPGGFSIGV